MHKIIFILLMFLTFSLYSEERVAEPYRKDEFLPVFHDIRRASIIFCGAFPLGYMYASIIEDPIFSQSIAFDDLEENEKNNKQIEIKLISSLIFASIVMIIDLIIEKII